MKYEDEPGLSSAVINALRQYDAERAACPHPHAVTAQLPPEVPIPPGATVAMPMALYFQHDDESRELWRDSGVSAVGVVAGVNYGRAEGEPRNYWRYRVVWQFEGWEMTRPDGEVITMAFSSEPGLPGWPHPWRHDMLVVMRGLPGAAQA